MTFYVLAERDYYIYNRSVSCSVKKAGAKMFKVSIVSELLGLSLFDLMI